MLVYSDETLSVSNKEWSGGEQFVKKVTGVLNEGW